MIEGTRRERLAAVLLLLLGLLSTIGIIFGSRTLRLLGIASLASPLLVVYSELGGYRLMEIRPRLLIVDVDGKSYDFVWDREQYNAVAQQENPFNRHIIILGYTSAINLMLDPKRERTRRQAYLAHGLCENGPLSKYLKIDRPVREVQVLIDDDIPPDRIMKELRFQCPSVR